MGGCMVELEALLGRVKYGRITMRTSSLRWRIITGLVALGLPLGLLAGAAGVAQASPVPRTTSYEIMWEITDGSLAVQSTDAVNHVIGTLTPAVNTVAVICQVNNGSTDPYDNLSSRTWDAIWWGNRVAWVYDWFIETPPQGSDGFSHGVNDDGQGPPPHC